MYFMSCVCASAISAEMKEWVRIGGKNSGCCGDSRHKSGFHVPATNVPASDYSRRHDKGKPYRMNWGCAGDFSHGFDKKLRAQHVKVLSRLMNGELPMICEMITKPWADRPVYYWARWNGNKTLKKYTGTGHDHWSHISWWRSKANQRANLWVPAGTKTGGSGGGASAPAGKPKYPGRVLKKNESKVDPAVKTFQEQAKKRGAKITADGRFGPATEAAVKALQKSKGLTVDGIIGPKTWAANWS